MTYKPTIPPGLAAPLLPIAACLLAIGIFLVDTFSGAPDAVAVLYVIVVMLAANFSDQRGVLVVGFGCAALTLISFTIEHGLHYGSASFMRCLVSLAAIGIATFLTLKNKSAESLLREQANLLDVSHDAIFVRDTRDIITYWNRGAEQIYGWNREQAVGKVSHSLMQTIFPAPLDELSTELRRVGRWEGELVHTKQDGTQVTVGSRWSLQRDAQGRPAATLETDTDITERKRAEDALRRSEAYLAEAQRLSLTGSFGWNVTNEELISSEETYRIFQYDPATTLSLELMFKRVHPEDLAMVRQRVERASNFGENWELEHRLLMPDGSVRYVNVVAHTARDSSGNLEFVGAVMDVTAARRAEEALQEAQANLAHVNRVTTLGEMTASIAHEVTQPIAAVVTNAGAGLAWLAAQPPNLEETQQALGRILRDGNRASEVISRIRALAKKMPPREDRVNINEAIIEVLALARGEVERNRVLARTELSSDLPTIPGDRIQLQQVILNLVVNAIEAMSGAGIGPRELVVSTRKEAANGVLVAVRDSGPGFDPESVDHLFDAFYTTKSAGIGMGLAICRSIIEAHEGRLWAVPNVPGGAIFQFSLPGDEERA
jgi:PAS domain S-box-containing protein